MIKLKKYMSMITIGFIVLCTASIVILSFAVINNIRVSYQMEQLDYLKKIRVEKVQSFANPIEQDDAGIKDWNYLAAFLHEYVYEDIRFLTSCEGWDEERLELAALELFENTHGDEIKLITAVVFEEGDGAFTYGYQHSGNEYFPIVASLHGFFPQESTYYHAHEKSVLYVTNVTARTDVGDYAQALSIAYGYHFVNYYMGLEGINEDIDTEYYTIRAEGNENIKLEFEDNDDYMENYRWDLEIIAANDYMYLMGSDNANRIVTSLRNKYYDEIDIDTWEGVYMAVLSRYINGRNITPHININMDLPDSVDGLAEYFYSFVDEEPPEYSEPEPMGDLNFSLERNTLIYSIYQNRDSIYWTAPYESDEVIYFVLEYSMDDRLVDIITYTKGSGEKEIHMGAYRNQVTGFGFKAIYRLSENQVNIRIIAAFPDGSIAISDPYEYVYDESKLEEDTEE